MKKILVIGVALTMLTSCGSGDDEIKSGEFGVVSADLPAAGASVSCPGSTVMLSGGCDCGVDGTTDGNIDQMFLNSSTMNDFFCICENDTNSGDDPAVYATCFGSTSDSITLTSQAITSDDTITNASCTGGKVAIGASLNCDDDANPSQPSAALYPVDSDTWAGVCTDALGVSPSVSVHCIDPSSEAISGRTLTVTSQNFTGISGSISCSSGQMISGGCSCGNPGYSEMDASYTTDLETWHCTCESAGAGTAYALCAQ